MRRGDEDVIMDALAMIEAAHGRDFEGLGVIARNGNLRLVAVMLARICDDLISDLAAWHDAAGSDLIARLRAVWTKP